MKTARCFLAFVLLVVSAAAQTKPKVRTICAFVRIDRNNYQQVVREAEPVLLAAKRAAEAAGYEVETVRITTQPFPEYTRGLPRADAVAFLRQFNDFVTAEAKRLNVNIARNIGPAMMKDDDDPANAEVLAEVLAGDSQPDSSLIVAGEDGVHWRGVRAAAHIIKYAADHSPHSQGTFAFAAAAMVAPYGPFYPASYHTGAGKQFAIGIEGAGVVDEVFSHTRDPKEAVAQLTAALTVHAQAMEKIGREVAASTGWEYLGFDPTPAPLKDVSIGAAIEKFTGGKFGTSGTMTAASVITQAVKAVPVKQVGYSGLMLPVLEDARMAERWTERTYTIDSVLAYSAVCATGLDTIPLPGDVTEEQLARMIGDVASLAVKWHKPLTARLQPVAGKRAGERTDFQDPFMVNAVLQPLP